VLVVSNQDFDVFLSNNMQYIRMDSNFEMMQVRHTILEKASLTVHFEQSPPDNDTMLSADILSPTTIDETVVFSDQLLSIPQEWLMDEKDTDEIFIFSPPTTNKPLMVDRELLPPANAGVPPQPPVTSPVAASSSDENRVMVHIFPSSSNFGTQYFDEHMIPAVDRR
jgi:hypothetical protein